MAKTANTTTTTTESIPTVAMAQGALSRLQTEAAELRRLVTGETSFETMRHEERVVIRATGAAEVVGLDVPVLETRPVPALERLQAKRRLAALEPELALAEELVEVATAAAASAARAQRERAIRDGEQEVRRLLPSLIEDTRALQARFATFHEEIARLDGAVGAGHFMLQAACPMFAPTGMADAWIAFVSDAFPPDRR